jgi:hypothetical protein
VVTWKDQSGNGNDATAAASTNEPTIYTGGALVKQDGRVGIDFDGSTDYLISTISSVSQPFDFYSVFKYDTIVGGGTERLYWTQNILNRARNGSSFDYMYAGAVLSAGNKSRELIRLQETHVYNGSSSAFRRSGTQMVSGNVGSLSTGTSLYIGSNNTGAADNCIEGVLQEMILFDNSKSAGDRTSIEENQGDYFTQNTPLLDTYSGAAAAYSLRLLDSTYTGSAVEVYNGSSYADIGFNVFGELDTVALAAHCGSNNGFVSKWYDQSGNSNDAAQTTTANMPKIYDGTTGVVTEHGKPCAQFDGANDFFQISPSISAANGFIAALVSEISATGATEVALNVRGANCVAGNQIFYNSSTGLTYASGRTSACGYQATNASGMNSIAVGLWDWANDTLTVEFDGVAATPNTNITETSTTIDRIRLGVDSGVNYADCKIHECIIWPSNALTIADISDSINTFYNIY